MSLAQGNGGDVVINTVDSENVAWGLFETKVRPAGAGSKGRVHKHTIIAVFTGKGSEEEARKSETLVKDRPDTGIFKSVGKVPAFRTSGQYATAQAAQTKADAEAAVINKLSNEELIILNLGYLIKVPVEAPADADAPFDADADAPFDANADTDVTTADATEASKTVAATEATE